ncbi:hypothetical protein G3A43_09265 [Paraburkholderia aspalathi]|nr:hypothetical protein [Paraburkholderia aspalathi]MBK3780416.1 hypothetical protein [Paraburkholderia aspalathi]
MQAENEQGQRGPETFRWEHFEVDVTALLRDLACGAVSERYESTFTREEIASYSAFLLGAPHPDVPGGMTQQHQIKVDVAYASSLPAGKLSRPVIALHVGQGQGTIEFADLEEGYNFVVVDGNHRIIRAQQLDVAEVPLVVLLEQDARRYWKPLDSGVL